MKNLFNFKKSPMTRAVYNSEYARFASRQSLEQVYSALYAHRRGLNEHDVEKRRRRFGENIVVHEERTNPMKLFVSAFINPFIGVLTVLVLISFVLDVVLAEPGEQDWTTIIIISTMVVFSAILRFVQELNAGRSSDALLKMVKNTCYVERSDDNSGEIPVEELVPGDIVLLSAGDMIPADLRIVETKDFFVSQSSLTGESDSIEKTPLCNADEGSVVDLDNLAFMGSNVVSGTARGIVFATGNQTYLGSIAKSIAGHRAETAFDKGITKVVGVESRGFLLAPAVAINLGAGAVMARKPGKLPGEVRTLSYKKEYGEDTICMVEDSIKEDDVVLIHDDLLATGGSMLAVYNLVKSFHPKKIYLNFIIELKIEGLHGRDVFEKETEITTLLTV